MPQRRYVLTASTVGFLFVLGSSSALYGGCSPSPGGGDASVDSPSCDPDSSDTVGCPCDPSTFVNGSTCYTGPPGTEAKGACQVGKRSCDNGTFSACVGEVTPVPETCNYIDDDCDGIVDDLPAILEAGTVANCNSPACDPNYADAAITCWGPDLGICGAGVLACKGGPKGGTPTGCNEFIHGGVPEICNGFDDDCNGIIDDGLTMDGPCMMPDGSAWPPEASLLDTTNPTVILGACQNGNLACIDTDCNQHFCADAGDQCQPTLPVPESCNGLDDDCNGLIDEKSCTSFPGETYCCSYTEGSMTYGFCTSYYYGDGGVGDFYNCHYAQ